MKSCDFLFLAFLRIVAVYNDNFLHCTNQSGPLFFIDVLRFLIGRNVTKAHPVSVTDQQKTLVPPLGGILGGILLTQFDQRTNTKQANTSI